MNVQVQAAVPRALPYFQQLSAGDGYRCEIGDCINIELERLED
jgi:hypothetical protein